MKWIVCSAWPYVNTVPHLGTFIHLLSADVFTRYLRLNGEDVVAVTGSDEHGTPIEVEAIKLGKQPRELTDDYHALICDLLEKYEIDFSNYTRTESPVHVRYVQEFYKRVQENGYVYTQEVQLPYCLKDNRFLPDRFVEGICPHCGFEAARGDQCDNCGRVLDPLELKSSRCAFCGSMPIVKTSTHWFFDLPKLSDQLAAYIDGNKQLPDNARNFSKQWLSEGLKPRALTRDNRWGIPAPFPNSEGKTIYVWLEAVLGYVSAAVEWAERTGNPSKWKDYWFDKDTRNVHFIGKDNIPFHTIIFPALLLATRDGYVLPWQVASTEFILFDGKKFSKSHRIGVWIDEALKVAPADYWRYILIAIRPEAHDANFTWREFESHVNSELNDVIGNFVHRTLTFIKTNFDGCIPVPGPLDELDRKFVQRISESPTTVGRLFDNFRLRDALAAVVHLSRDGNQYLSDREPWHTVKSDRQRTATTIYLSVQLARTIAILLFPFTPKTSRSIWAQLGLSGSPADQRWETAGKLTVPSGHEIGAPTPLFRKVKAAEIESLLRG